ncbi:MAG: ABC transporter ATP-binding protein [Geobacteraceae bacterium]|nr:ABC transporter ATP-binding protein [Geobacteraceae bacterium]
MGANEIDGPVIELLSASVIYRKGKEEVGALRDIDFTLEPGEFVTVTGPSGAGKSTFLQLCGGILSPTAGDVRFMGVDRGKMADRDLAWLRSREIGFVFQSFNLLDYLPAEENVALPLMLAGVGEGERLERARQRLDALGLGHRRGHYPGELSGGECQRVAIARALVTDPPLLIADEPTGNLDHDSSAIVMDIFAAIHREGTAAILLVTHSPWVAGFGSRTVRIEEGRLV